MAQNAPVGLLGRARAASVSFANTAPQLGIWQAAGTAIAQAPNLTELREPDSGGSNIVFDAHGHSARVAKPDENGSLMLVKSPTRMLEQLDEEKKEVAPIPPKHPHLEQHRAHLRSLHERHKSVVKEKWGPTIMHGLTAFWKFSKTPWGFLIVLYCLNIVVSPAMLLTSNRASADPPKAWGAMLFFLALHAAPAMDHPNNGNDDSSPRKKWIEIDSQILNALFCVTGFGLAPWRFRDFYWSFRAVHFHHKPSLARLMQQNKAWFRPAAWYYDGDDEKAMATFTGKRAPPTAMWKLAFTVDMMVANTGLQAVLSYYMWAYNRIDRPGWATGKPDNLHRLAVHTMANSDRLLHRARLWDCDACWFDVLVGRAQGEKDRGAGG
jgi:hypothetical protein